MTEQAAGSSCSHEALIECTRMLARSVAELAAAVRADSPSELLTAEELAERFRIPARTIKDGASAGRLPHHRLGKHYRFSKDDIAEILRQTKQEPVRRSGRVPAVRAA
ncbi:helix-turn-helix domain-containing protein [Actinopolymorpha singaporensis]